MVAGWSEAVNPAFRAFFPGRCRVKSLLVLCTAVLPLSHLALAQARRTLTMRHSVIALAAICLFACSAIGERCPRQRPPSGTAWPAPGFSGGTIARKDTTHDIVSEWVLGHQYLRIHERSREKDGKGQPQYEAIVFIGWDAVSADVSMPVARFHRRRRPLRSRDRSRETQWRRDPVPVQREERQCLVQQHVLLRQGQRFMGVAHGQRAEQ